MPMPKGHTTKKVARREAIEETKKEIAESFQDDFKGLAIARGKNVLVKVFDQAEEGCRTSQKMILDRFAPAAKAIDANSGSGNLNIQINVQPFEREEVFVEEENAAG